MRESLDDSLVYMVEMLDYDLDCRVQTCKIQPRNPNSKYPSIKVTIGYAYKGTPKHSRLALLKSPDTISIDYSLNEAVPNVEAIKLDTEGGILVYSLTDIIAEKYRSLLQQIPRNRTRRQDVYDLNILISNIDTYDNIEKQKILDSLMAKCKAREITPSSASFDTPEIKERAKQEYSTLADEIEGDLPDFDALYDIVYGFYKSLPWK